MKQRSVGGSGSGTAMMSDAPSLASTDSHGSGTSGSSSSDVGAPMSGAAHLPGGGGPTTAALVPASSGVQVVQSAQQTLHTTNSVHHAAHSGANANAAVVNPNSNNSSSSSSLDEQIERLKRCEYLRENEVKALCLRAREILVDEGNVQRVDAPVTVSRRPVAPPPPARPGRGGSRRRFRPRGRRPLLVVARRVRKKD